MERDEFRFADSPNLENMGMDGGLDIPGAGLQTPSQVPQEMWQNDEMGTEGDVIDPMLGLQDYSVAAADTAVTNGTLEGNGDKAREYEERMAELSARIGTQKTNKVKTIVLVAILGVVLLFLLIANIDKIANIGKGKAEITEVPLPYIRLNNQSFTIPDMVYTDDMQVEKFCNIEEDSIVFYLKGTPKNFGKPIIFPVSSEVYNTLREGYYVKIEYQVLAIRQGEEVQDLIANVKIKQIRQQEE